MFSCIKNLPLSAMDGASAVLLPAFWVLMVWLLLGTVSN